MNHGRQPAGWGPVRAGAHVLAIFAVAALGTGGVAFATSPNEGGAPPEHAQGDGKPEAPPAAQQAPAAPQAKAKAKKPSTPAAGQVQGGDAHGMTGGGHNKARGNGHTGDVGQSKSGGGSAQAKAGKVTLCHATGSETNPFVTITVSENARSAHDAHQDGEDMIPAPAGGCPGGSSQNGPENENGKVTICHATGSETNPYVVITISENALEAHDNHQHGEDILEVPPGGCSSNAPSGIVSPETPAGQQAAGEQGPESGVLGVSEESGSGPSDDEGENGVLGANQGGGGEEGAARDTTGTSLPFTGLGLGLLAAIGLLLALSGGHLRRKAS